MVNVALPPQEFGSDHRTARDVKNAEGTRKALESCESAPPAPSGARRPARPRIRPGPCEAPQLARASAGRNTKGTQEPQESRRIRAMAGRQPGATRPQRKNPS
jgi:hypothetical protein